MKSLTRTLALAAATATLVACGTPDSPTGTPGTAALDEDGNSGNGSVHTVVAIDNCDPGSFNEALGAGSCVKKGGGLPFSKFIAQLTNHQFVSAWRFAPRRVNANVGEVLRSLNRGGEVHTFTEVDDFGGGIVPVLNQLSGTPVPAPECLALQPQDFIPPGALSEDEEIEEPGVERYQCCIHPWMRMTVHVRGTTHAD